jgi:transcriptional regulator with XRE-family HTH domain
VGCRPRGATVGVTDDLTAVTGERKRLAALLRQLREDTGTTQTEFGMRVGMNQAKVSRIEIGRQIPTRAEVVAWSDAAHVDDATRGQLMDRRAAALTEVSTWTDELTGGFAAKQARLALSERNASVIRAYSLIIPGLLQTGEYARRLITMQAPLHGGRFGDLPAAVIAWLDRQQVLYRTDGRFEFVIPETALRWRPGADAALVLAAQMHHLCTMSTLPAVRLGVIPSEAAATVCVPHDFTILGDPEVDEDVEVAVYTTTRAVRVREPTEIMTYLDVWARLCDSAVFDGVVTLLSALADEFAGRSPT